MVGGVVRAFAHTTRPLHTKVNRWKFPQQSGKLNRTLNAWEWKWEFSFLQITMLLPPCSMFLLSWPSENARIKSKKDAFIATGSLIIWCMVLGCAVLVLIHIHRTPLMQWRILSLEVVYLKLTQYSDTASDVNTSNYFHWFNLIMHFFNYN